MAGPRMGTFAELLAMTAEPLRPVVDALRSMVLALDPSATETVRLGDRAASYGIGPRKMIDGAVYILPHARWVNLGFYRGASLPDPEGLLEGTGAAMRHVKVRRVEEAARPGLQALVLAALAERHDALGR